MALIPSHDHGTLACILAVITGLLLFVDQCLQRAQSIKREWQKLTKKSRPRRRKK